MCEIFQQEKRFEYSRGLRPRKAQAVQMQSLRQKIRSYEDNASALQIDAYRRRKAA